MHQDKDQDSRTDDQKRSINRRRLVSGAIAGSVAASGLARASAQSTPAASPAASPGASPVGKEYISKWMTDQPQGTFPLTEEKKTLRVLVAHNPWVGDFVDNEFTRWFEERTNVKVEWTVLPQDDEQSALNVRLASGDYPDVILNVRPSPAVMQVYGTAGTFIPLNDLIEKHGVYTKWAWENTPRARPDSTAADGNIYALPDIGGCYHCSMSSKLWYYHDWLDTLGMKVPETTEEYADFLRAIKSQDPNGNGKSDEIPYTSSPNMWNGSIDRYFMNSFVFTPPSDERLFVKDGKITPSYTQEGWREGILWLNSLASEGLISPESFTQDFDSLTRQTNADPAIVGSLSAGSPEYSSWDHIGWYKTIPPLKGPDGTRIAAWTPTEVYGGTFIITDKCEDPVLAFRWADAQYEYETGTRANRGVKDVDWRWAYEGETGIDGEQAIWKRLVNDLGPNQKRHWGQTGTFFRPTSWALGEVIDPTVPRDKHLEALLYDETKNNYEPYRQPDDWVVPVLYFNEDQSQVVAELGPVLNPYVSQTLAQGVLGQIDIETTWSEYLTTLDNMGMQDYLSAFQEAYETKMSNL